MIRCEPAQIKHHAQGPVPVDIDICLADFFPGCSDHLLDIGRRNIFINSCQFLIQTVLQSLIFLWAVMKNRCSAIKADRIITPARKLFR